MSNIRKRISSSSTSRSEKALFDIAACLNGGWDVWMNPLLKFEDKKNHQSINHEVDCILYHRDYGMLLIECKDGQISTEEAQGTEKGFVWKQGHDIMDRSPIQQIEQSIHPLHDHFSDMFPKEGGNSYFKVRVQWAVCFADMENMGKIGNNAIQPKRIILKQDLKSYNTLERKVKKILETKEDSHGGKPFPNDRLNDQISLRKVVEEEDGKTSTVEISTIGKTNLVKRRTLDINVRGYAIRTKAPSQVYPSFGIGAELGLRTHPGKSRFYSPSMYVYAYGYAPGLRYDQGFRFSFSGQTSLNHKEYSYTDGYISMVPRGFVESSLGGILTRASSHSFKVTVDYAVPFLSVDWSFLCPAFYIKNFQLTPFADISVQDFNYSRDFLINPGNVASETLLSCGADLVVNLGNFLWLPFDSRFGIRYARNWWSTIDSFPIGKLERNYIGTVFSVDF